MPTANLELAMQEVVCIKYFMIQVLIALLLVLSAQKLLIIC